MLSIEFTQGGWFDGLPDNQSQELKKMLDFGKTEEQIAELFLSSPGADSTSGFGASGPNQSFFLNVKQEFTEFICGNPKYEEERKQVEAIWKEHGKTVVVSMISAFIAVTVGLTVAALTPVVALLLALVSKVGVNAFCTTCADVSSEA